MNLLTAIIIVLVTLIVGSTLYVLIARKSPEGGREHNTPTDVYGVTGGAMALLIAFTMSMTFQQYNSAQQAAQAEAEAVTAMSRAATFMEPNLGGQLRDQLVCYGQEVMTDEWQSMREGRTDFAPSIRATLNTMDQTLADNVQAAGAGLDMWETANQARHAAHIQRLHAAGNGVPTIVWLLLIFGSLVTVGSLFVYADSSKPAWGHALVVIGPLFVASAALVVIAFFDHPYADTPGGIRPDAMEVSMSFLTSDPINGAPVPSCPTPT